MYTVTEKSRIHEWSPEEYPAANSKCRTKMTAPCRHSDTAGVFRKKIEEHDDIEVDRLCQQIA